MADTYFHLAEVFLAGPERCRDVYTPEDWKGFFEDRLPYPKLKDVFEFNRLFVGPFVPMAPPYASVYLSRDEKPTLMGETTMKVRQYYQETGIQLRMKNEFPEDFIGFEMEFLGLCLANEMEKSYSRFIQEHAGQWISLWSQRVQSNTTNEFCLRLSELIRELVYSSEGQSRN